MFLSDIEEHIASCEETYGYGFKKIHKWMDELTKLIGPNHRKERHDPLRTPDKAEKIFWNEVPEEYRFFIRDAVFDHILLDEEVPKERCMDCPFYPPNKEETKKTDRIENYEEKRESIFDIIRESRTDLHKHGAPIELVKEMAMSQGLSEESVDIVLKKERRAGRLYPPAEGMIALAIDDLDSKKKGKRGAEEDGTNDS